MPSSNSSSSIPINRSPYMMQQPGHPMMAPASPSSSSSNTPAEYIYNIEQKAWPYIWLFLGFVLMLVIIAFSFWLLKKSISSIRGKKHMKSAYGEYPEDMEEEEEERKMSSWSKISVHVNNNRFNKWTTWNDYIYFIFNNWWMTMKMNKMKYFALHNTRFHRKMMMKHWTFWAFSFCNQSNNPCRPNNTTTDWSRFFCTRGVSTPSMQSSTRCRTARTCFVRTGRRQTQLDTMWHT